MSRPGCKYIVNIMAHNEEESVRETIQTVLRQKVERGSRIKVHVFANACIDKTEDIVRNIAESSDDVQLHSITKKGKANALGECISYFKNEGSIEVIEGMDRLFFVDADICINDENLLFRLSKRLDSSEGIYLVSALPVPESLYNGKRDFVSDLFRVRFQLQYAFRKNLVRGACYVVRWSVVQRLELPKGLVSDDMFLECILDGHFLMDHDLHVVIKLKKSLRLEVKRDLLHQIGREQVYRWRRRGLVRRLDRNTALPQCFLSPLDPKEYLLYLVKRMKIKAIMILSIWMAIFKINQYRATRIFVKRLKEDVDLLDYWSTQR